MKSFGFREMEMGENFDLNNLHNNTPFTQANFYGDWQENLGRKVRRFLVNDGEKTVAYFQLIKFPLLFGKSYLYIPYGPITTDFSDEFFVNLKQKLQQIAKSEGVIFVRLDFTPLISSDILLKFFTKAPLCTYRSPYFQPRAEWFLGLNKSESELLSLMHKNTRYSIKLAEERGVSVEIVTEGFEKYFEDFYKLMAETAKKNNFNIHQKEYYKNIFQNIPKDSYLSIARYGEKILTIKLVIVFGKIANHIFSGRSGEEKNRMPAYLAQWKSICHAKKLGCDFYNFGGISTEDKTNKNWDGLTIFKKKFGGEEVIRSDFFDLIMSPFWYWLYSFRKYIRNLI